MKKEQELVREIITINFTIQNVSSSQNISSTS